MAEKYRIVLESAKLVYIEVTGMIGDDFLRDFRAVLTRLESDICVLLRNTAADVAGPGVVRYLIHAFKDDRLAGVAAFDLTSAQTLLVESTFAAEGSEVFRVFESEHAARQHLTALCG
jgi:hypothetical protein